MSARFDPIARGLATRSRMELARVVPPRRPRVLVTGDSIPRGGYAVTNGNAEWGDSWAQQALWRSGGRAHALANTGVAGNTSTQMLARWQADVIAWRPDVVLLMIGANDIGSGGGTSQIGTLMRNIEQMVLQSLAAGILPVIATPPAKDAAKPEMRRAIPYFYRLAEAYDLPLLDMFAVTVDPVTGGWKSGWSGDGTHPGATAIAAMAAYAGPILADLAAYQPRPYLAAYSETAAGNPANLIRNGSFAQQATPGVPDGWAIASAGAAYDATQAPAAPFTGKEFAYTKSSGGAAYPLSGDAGLYAGQNQAAGDKVRFSGSIEVSGLPGSPAGFNVMLDSDQQGLRPFYASKCTGNFTFSADMTIQPGHLGLAPAIYVGDTGTYKIRNLTAINLTAMDAVWKPANGR